VGVEKGTKAVISMNFSVYGEPTFNNLRTNFIIEIPRKEFFNSHGLYHQQFYFRTPDKTRFAVSLPTWD
jgi:hypothetical protein